MNNNESKLILVRGLPGAGKTSFAGWLSEEFEFPQGDGTDFAMFCADDFFMDGEEYKFNPSLLGEAHADCQQKTRTALDSFVKNVVVHNTFVERWEMQPYFDIASELSEKYNFPIRVVVVSVFDGGLTDEELAERNSHGVPVEAIKNMRARWEHDWKIGNPTPPWLRK